MYARCPHCRVRVPAWAGLFVGGRNVGYCCQKCESHLILTRNWKYARRVLALVFMLVAFVGYPVLTKWFGIPKLHHPWAVIASCGGASGLALAVVAWFFPQKAQMTIHGRRCRRCRYDLSGLAHARCPECGEESEIL